MTPDYNDHDGNAESNRRVREDWRIIKKIIFQRDYLLGFIAASVLFIDLVVLVGIAGSFTDNKEINVTNVAPTSEESNSEESDEEELSEEEEKNCDVYGIQLRGELVTYIPKDDYTDFGEVMVDKVGADDIGFIIKQAEENENVKAVIVEVDSSGGDPVAAEELEKAFKRASKPIITYVRGVGASAAYWAISGADKIYASPSSQVGSIAINGSYLDEVKLNELEGYNFNDLATGKFKNITNRNKPLTAEEKEWVMKDLYQTHDVFVKTVADNRKLELKKVQEIANGWAYTGTEALSFGLVDELGGLPEVEEYLKNNVLNGNNPSICW